MSSASSLSLTANEQQLLIDLEDGEQGMADYGLRMFQGSLLLHLDELYKWQPVLKLWKPLTSKGEAQQIFVKQILEDAKSLQKKLKAGSLQVSVALEADPEDKALTALAQEIKTGLARVKSALGIICQIPKQNAIWGKIRNQLISVQKLNGYNDVLPLRGGNKICLRKGIIAERTKEDLWSFEIQADGLEASAAEHEANAWFYNNYARDENGVIDAEMLPFLQEVCAYATVFETCGKCFFVIKGVSDTGKSFFFDRLAKLLKGRVGGCSPEVFTDTGREEGHKTYYQDLEGKSGVCISELKENAPINGAQMKRLTGDDIIPYRPCYGTYMRYLVMTAVIFILTNFTQSFNGGDTGMITRFVQIPFRYKHKKGHKMEYKERMRLLNSQGGYNATLAWIVEGTKQLFAKIESGEEILVQPKIVQEASQVSVQENDHFLAFLSQCCDVWTEETGVKPTAYTYARRPLQNAYTAFMLQHPEYKPNKLNPTEFKARVQAEYSNGKADGDWVGIRPKTFEPLGE